MPLKVTSKESLREWRRARQHGEGVIEKSECWRSSSLMRRCTGILVLAPVGRHDAVLVSRGRAHWVLLGAYDDRGSDSGEGQGIHG